MSCEKCRFRGWYDNNPTSLGAKLWRWHIGFCPGWKRYFKSLSEERKVQIAQQYDLPYPVFGKEG